MNTVESFINNLIERKDVNIDDIDTFYDLDNVNIDPDKIDAITEMNTDFLKSDAFWDPLISVLHEKSLSEKTIHFLYRNELAVTAMCHKKLPDKWLRRYARFDEEPLYIMADRYMKCDDAESDRFIMEFAIRSENIFEYMLDHLEFSTKWEKMIFAGVHYGNSEIKARALLEMKLFEIKNTVDEDLIRNAYELHSNEGNWLLCIASNLNTPMNILENLQKIQNIKHAKMIRSKCRETLRVIIQLENMGQNQSE